MNVCIAISTGTIRLVNQMIDQNHVHIQAIFTDDKIFAVSVGCPEHMTFNYWDFREVVKQLNPDYILVLAHPNVLEFINNELKKIDMSSEKIIELVGYMNSDSFELYGRLTYFEQNPTRYKIFITGSSYSYWGINESQLNLPTINFAFQGQDLYYDYEIAKKLIPPPPRKK